MQIVGGLDLMGMTMDNNRFFFAYINVFYSWCRQCLELIFRTSLITGISFLHFIICGQAAGESVKAPSRELLKAEDAGAIAVSATKKWWLEGGGGREGRAPGTGPRCLVVSS
jgi:hypothetical protein